MLSPGSIRRARISLPPRSGLLAGRLLASLIACMALASAGLAQVRLEGKVRTDTGEAIKSGVNVRVETEDGQLVAEQPANSEGAFHFDSLPKINNCRLIVNADGFERYQEGLDLGYGATQATRYITLRPLGKEAVDGAAGEARTDSLAPKNARKEYEQAVGDFAAKNLAGARTHFEAAVKEYPCYARAQTDLATVREAQRDLTGAETALKKARECDPDYIDSYIVLGQMLNSEKRYADSEQVLQEGVRRSPGSWQFYYQLGVAHFGLGQYAKAQSEYERVPALNPSPPAEFHVKMADLYLKEKSYDKAYSQMDEYLKAEPSGPFASKIKNIMQQMQASGVLHPAQATKP